MKTTQTSPEKSGGSSFRSRGRHPFVQKKGTINQPGDKYEQEADRAAQDVAGGNPVSVAPSSYNQMGEADIPGTEDKMGAIRHERTVQRKEEGEGDISGTQDQMGAIQRKEESADAPAADVSSTLEATKGGGDPLPGNVKNEMESGFDRDFSDVRVHTGSQAADMNKSLSAKAFTNDADVYFNEGNYNPESKEGKELLAHELTHTVQQGAVGPKQVGDKQASSAEVAEAKRKADANPELKEQSEKVTSQLADQSKSQAENQVPVSDAASEQPAVEAQQEKTENAEGELAAPEQEAADIAQEEDTKTLDEAVEKEVASKAKASPEQKPEVADASAEGMKKPEGKEEGMEGAEKKDDGPEGVKEDYENPAKVKKEKTDPATDKAGEQIEPDEEANVNVEGLIMTAQQFRDQGKESVDRAKEQARQRMLAEQKVQEFEKKVEHSDKSLNTAEKNTVYREKRLPQIMDKGLATSKQRQEKIQKGSGEQIQEYNKNKGTAKDLKKESAGIDSGSKKNKDADEKESAELGSNTEQLSNDSAVMADGVSGAGDKAKKLASDAVVARSKNTATEKDLKESKGNIQKTKSKITSEKSRNRTARTKLKSFTAKFLASKKKEEQLTGEGMSLMKTSFQIENETHRAQHFYYKDMKNIEGADQMILEEEQREHSAMANGPEALMFRYAALKSDGEREAFFNSLGESDRMRLGANLESFNANFETWLEAKKLEYGTRVEQKRVAKINQNNMKRNQSLEIPLGRATDNIDRISKTGLLWTSLTESLGSMWEGLKNITWADVSKMGLAMINPMETYNTVADAVGGIWTDLSDWGGFSEDPVGMILQKGSGVASKLLTISSTITGLMTTLTILLGAAAIFVPVLWPFVIWLGTATGTMWSITFWIGVVAAALSVMSGIKNIFNIHGAKTAQEIYQGNHKLKKDAGNTLAAVGTIAAGRKPPPGPDMSKMGKFKNGIKVAFKAGKSFVKNGIRQIPHLAGAIFKKSTWSNLYDGFKSFGKKKKGGLPGNNKSIAGKADNFDAPKHLPETKTPAPKKHVPEASPKKQLEPDLKQPKSDVEMPAAKQSPETIVPETGIPDPKKTGITDKLEQKYKAPDADAPTLKKGNAELDAPKTKMDETDLPKNKQVADGEKPPKSDLLKYDPHLKDEDLDNFKKYEDDVDASTKKKMEEDADRDVDKGKNHDSKAKALAMARVIVAANDRIDTPIPLLMAELAPLKAMKGVRGFGNKNKGNGVFHIVMYGSVIDIGDTHLDKNENENQSNSNQNKKLISGQSKKYKITDVVFKGLVQNRYLRELSHQELFKAFQNTSYTLSNHAIKRLKDIRTDKLGFKTLNDIKQIFNKGTLFDANDGLVGISHKGMEVILNPVTNIIVTFRPAKIR